jgi:hypothetical protein
MTSLSRIDDCLSKRNGHLFIEECDTAAMCAVSRRRFRKAGRMDQ